MKKSNWLKITVISLIIIGSAACSTPKIITVPVELSRPARPVLPAISSAEANAINYATWLKISERNRLMRQYAEQLEGIIDSTKEATK